MAVGTGIAIAGIWLGVGIAGFGAGDATVGVAIMAAIATGLILKVEQP